MFSCIEVPGVYGTDPCGCRGGIDRGADKVRPLSHSAHATKRIGQDPFPQWRADQRGTVKGVKQCSISH